LGGIVTLVRSEMKGGGELAEDQNGIEAMVDFGKSMGRQEATEKSPPGFSIARKNRRKGGAR
jgi:hypothetical protein